MVSANDRETLAERLRAVATSNARLFLEQRNVRRVVMEGLKPIASVEGSIAGPAHTIRFLPAREDVPTPPGQSLPFWLCDNVGAGEVLVCDALGCMDGAVFGDMMATRAKYRQAAGAVIDGVVRDVSGIAATGLPVFARGSYAHPFGGRLLPWENNVPVQCGGVLVRPGDWILAARDRHTPSAFCRRARTFPRRRARAFLSGFATTSAPAKSSCVTPSAAWTAPYSAT